MNEGDLWELGGPPLVVIDAGSTVPLRAAIPPSGSTVVARLDGSTMIDADNVFEQFYDAMGRVVRLSARLVVVSSRSISDLYR